MMDLWAIKKLKLYPKSNRKPLKSSVSPFWLHIEITWKDLTLLIPRSHPRDSDLISIGLGCNLSIRIF